MRGLMVSIVLMAVLLYVNPLLAADAGAGNGKEVQAKSDADLKKTILEGAGKMKPVKDVDAKSADDIVSYLRTLAKK